MNKASGRGERERATERKDDGGRSRLRGRRGCRYKFRVGWLERHDVSNTSVPRVRSSLSLSLCASTYLSLSLSSRLSPTQFLSLYLPIPLPASLSILSLGPTHPRSFSSILFLPLTSPPLPAPTVSPVRAHTFDPTGEHSPCQTRIDLTLSVADYKSDQLGARCACRMGIGERSEGANVGA